ncbi:unnamed protein product [Spodoptera exigua]|nr:unnamed protein product [Spodoptera exigua]
MRVQDLYMNTCQRQMRMFVLCKHLLNKSYGAMYFLCNKSANEQTDYLMVSNQRRPWTPATEELRVRCRPFRG